MDTDTGECAIYTATTDEPLVTLVRNGTRALEVGDSNFELFLFGSRIGSASVGLAIELMFDPECHEVAELLGHQPAPERLASHLLLVLASSPDVRRCVHPMVDHETDAPSIVLLAQRGSRVHISYEGGSLAMTRALSVGAVGGIARHAKAHSVERLYRVVTWDYDADSALRFHVDIRRAGPASSTTRRYQDFGPVMLYGRVQ